MTTPDWLNNLGIRAKDALVFVLGCGVVLWDMLKSKPWLALAAVAALGFLVWAM